MDRLTKEQATVITVMTGVLVLDPRLFRRTVEERVGREIFPAEWANPDFLLRLKDLYREDLAKLCCMIDPDTGEEVADGKVSPIIRV